MHVLILHAHVSIAHNTLPSFGPTITRMFFIVFEFNNLLAVLARLRLE